MVKQNIFQKRVLPVAICPPGGEQLPQHKCFVEFLSADAPVRCGQVVLSRGTMTLFYSIVASLAEERILNAFNKTELQFESV